MLAAEVHHYTSMVGRVAAVLRLRCVGDCSTGGEMSPWERGSSEGEGVGRLVVGILDFLFFEHTGLTQFQ